MLKRKEIRMTLWLGMFFVFVMISGASLFADTHYWNGDDPNCDKQWATKACWRVDSCSGSQATPAAGDTVIIASTADGGCDDTGSITVNVVANTLAIAVLQVRSGATVTIGSGGGAAESLKVTTAPGTVTISGGATIKTLADGVLAAVGTVTVGDAGGSGTIINTNKIDLSGGAGNLVISSNGSLVMNAADAIVLMGSGTYRQDGSVTANGCVQFAALDGGKISGSANPVLFQNLRIARNTSIDGNTTIKILNTTYGAADCKNGFELDGGTFTAGSGTIKVGLWDASGGGAFAESTSTVILTGTMNVPQTSAGAPQQFYTLQIGEAGSPITATIAGTGNLNIRNNLVISSGSTLSNSGGNTINVYGDWLNYGTYSGAAGHTVNLYGQVTGRTPPFSIAGTTTFERLVLKSTAPAQYTLGEGASITINTGLTLEAGTVLNASPGLGQAATITIGPNASFTKTGKFNPKGSTFIWKPLTAVLVTTPNDDGYDYYNLKLGSNGSVSVGGNITIEGDLTIQSTANFSPGSYTIRIKGDWYQDGSFTAGGSTVQFIGSDSEILKAPSSAIAVTFNNLTIGDSDGDVTTIFGNKQVTVTGTFTIDGTGTTKPTFNCGSSTIFATSTWVNGGNFNAQTCEFRWGGTTIPEDNTGNAHVNFYSLTLTGAATLDGTNSTKTFTVNKHFKIDTGGSFAAGSPATPYTIYIKGDIINNNSGSSFDAGNSTIVLNGATKQQIKGTASITLNNLQINKTSGTVDDKTVELAFNIAGDDLIINGALDIYSGVLDLGGTSDTLVANGNFNVGNGSGTDDSKLKMYGGVTLKMANGRLLTIKSDGILDTANTGSIPTITSKTPGTEFYAIKVEGKINSTALNLYNLATTASNTNVSDPHGLTVTTTGHFVAFDNVTFDYLQGSGNKDTYLRIFRDALSPAQSYNFNGITFNNTSSTADVNIFVNRGGQIVSITLDASKGALGGANGENYDENEAGPDPTPGNIIWNVTLVWQGDVVGDQTNWFNPDNWDLGQVPNENSSVEINACTVGTNCPDITGQNAVVKNITQNDGSTLKITGAYTLTIYNTWLLNGTATFDAGNASTVIFAGSTSQTIPALTYYNLRLSNSSGITTPATPIYVNNNLILDAGAILSASSADISIAGSFINNGGTFDAQSSTFRFNGNGLDSQNIPALTFYNIEFSGTKPKVFTGDITINNNITIKDGATVSASDTIPSTITVKGNWSNGDTGTGTFNPGMATVKFNGGKAQTYTDNDGVGVNFFALKLEGTGTSLAFLTDGSPAGVTITTTDNAGNIGWGDVNIGSGTTLDLTNDTLNIGGSWINNGSLTATGSTVSFNASAAQEIKSATTFNNLTINNSSPTAKVSCTMTSGGITVNGNLLVSDGILDLGSGLTHSVTGTTTISNGAKIEVNTSTISLTGTVTVNGTLDMIGNDSAKSTLILVGNVALTVSATGTFQTSTSGTNPFKPLVTSDSLSDSNYFSFTVNGTINVNGLQFAGSDQNGLTINSGATITNFNNVDFQNLKPGDLACDADTDQRCLRINVTAGTYTFYFVTFDSSCTCNCSIPSTSTIGGITFQSYGGSRGGPSYEYDVPGKITWFDDKTWVGGGTAGREDWWSQAANWSPSNAAPSSTTNVTIPSNPAYIACVNTATGVAGAITVNAGATLKMNGDCIGTAGDVSNPTITVTRDVTLVNGTPPGVIDMTAARATLNVGGNWTDDGYALNQTGSTSLVKFTGTSSIINNAKFYRMEIGSGANVTIGSGKTVKITGSGSAFTITGTLNGGSGTIETNTWTRTGTWNYNTSTVRWMASTNVPNEIFYNLEIGDGTTCINATLGSNITVKNNLTIKSCSTLSINTYTLTVEGSIIIEGGASVATLNGNTGAINIKGNFTINGNWVPGTSNVTFNGSGTQTISGSATQPFVFNDIIISDGVTLSLGGNVRLATSGTDTGDLSTSGTGIIKLNSYTLEIQGTWTDNGSATNLIADTGEIFFNGASQTLPAINATTGETFYKIRFGGSGKTYTLPSGTTTVQNNLTFDGTSTGSILSCGTNTLNVGGNWVDSDALNDNFNEGTGKVVFNGTIDQSISIGSNEEFYNVEINNTGTGKIVLASTALVINGTLTITAGRFELGTDGGEVLTHSIGAITINGGVLDLSDSTVTVSGNLAVNSGGTLDLTQGNATPFLTVNGNVTITSGASNAVIDMTGATGRISVGGNWTNSGVFNYGSGEVEFTGIGKTISASGTNDFYKVRINPGAGNTISASTNLGITSDLTIATGTFDITNKTVKVSGNISNSGTLRIGTTTASGTLDLDGQISGGTLTFVNGGGSVMTFSGTNPTATTSGFAPSVLNANDGTIIFDNTTAAQNIPAFTYNNLKIAKGTQTATAIGNLTVNGNLEVTSGTLNLDDATPRTHTVGGTLTNSGTLTIDLSGTSISVTGTTTNNGTINLGTGTYTAGGAIDNNGTINISNGTLDCNGALDTTGGTLSFNNETGGVLRLAGALTIGTGTLNEDRGTIIFDGLSQTIPAETYYNLKTGSVNTTYTLGGNIIVKGDLTIDEIDDGTKSTLDVSINNYNITIGGSLINNGSFNSGSGTATVTFNGTAANLSVTKGANGSALSFNNLEVNIGSSSILTLNTGITVNGSLTNAGGTLNLGTSQTHSVSGAISINGGMIDFSTSTLTALSGLTVGANGTLKLVDSSVLKVADTKSIVVDGSINTSYTTTKPRITRSGASGSWGITLRGSININGLTLEYMNSSGLVIDCVASGCSGFNLQALNRVEFLNAASTGGTHLNLAFVSDLAPGTPTTYTYDISDPKFDNSIFAGGTPDNTPSATHGYVVLSPSTNANVSSLDVNISNAVDTTGSAIDLTVLENNDWDSENTVEDDKGLINFLATYKWNGSVSTDWANVNNWDGPPAAAPVESNPDVRNVIIPATATNNPSINPGVVAKARALSIEAGKTLTLVADATGYGQIKISGNLDNNGTLTAQVSGANKGKIILDGTTLQSLGGTGSYSVQDLEVNKVSGSVSTNITLTINGDLSIKRGTVSIASGKTLTVMGATTIGDSTGATNGTLNLETGTFIARGSLNNTATYGTITFGTSGTGVLRIEGGSFSSPGTFNAGNGTVVFTKLSVASVPALTYYNFILEDDGDLDTEEFTLSGGITVNNNLTIGASTKLSPGTNNIEVKGNWTNNGVFTPLAGTVILSGGSANITPGSGANDNFYNLTINSTGTKTLVSNLLDVDGALTITKGTLYLGNITGNEVAGSVTIGDASNIGVLALGTGSMTISGNLTVTNGTVDLTGAGASLTVFGNFTNGANGVLNFASPATPASMSCAGNWSDSGTTNPGNGTITLSGANKTLSSRNSSDFNNLTISGSYTLQSNIDVDGNMTITGTLTPGSYTIKVAGNWDDSAGSFRQTAGTVIFDGVTQSITTDTGSGNNKFNILQIGDGVATPIVTVATGKDLEVGSNLIIKDGARLNLNANLVHTVGGNLTIEKISTAGTLDVKTGKLTVTGSTTVNGTLDMSSTSASSQGLVTAGLTNTGTITFGTLGKGTITCNGNWSNTGTFIVGNSNVIIQGTSTIKAEATTGDFYNLTIDGTVSMDGTATNGLDIDGTLTINSGKSLTLSSLTHDIAGATTITGSMSISSATVTFNDNVTISATTGALTLGDSAIVKLANTKGITVNGSFTTSYTSTKPKVTSTLSGTDRFSFTVNSGGKINLAGLQFDSPDSNGLTINQGATIIDIDYVDFTNAANGGRFLAVLFSSGTYIGNYSNCTFDNTFGASPPGYNVVVANTTGETLLNFTNFSGSGAGEAYDCDATNASIAWVEDITWTGLTNTSWALGSNWSTGYAPGEGSNCIIPNTTNKPTLNTTVTIASLNIQDGAELNMSGAYTLTVNSNVTIAGGATGGKINITYATAILKVKGDLLDNTTNGGINNTAGKIVMLGSNAQLYAKTIKTLEIGDGTKTVSVTVPSTKELKIAALGSVTVKGNATLRLDEGKITMGDGATLAVDAGGKFEAGGTGAEITVPTPGTDRFNFNISGIVNIKSLILRSMGTDGLYIASGATITKLQNIKFYNHPGGTGSFLTIASGGYNVDGLTSYFDTISSGYNVKVTGNGGVIRFEKNSNTGAGSGDAYNCDGDGNNDGIADSTGCSSPATSVVLWNYTIEPLNTGTEPAPQVIGFPTAAFDSQTFAFYSTYVVTKDINGVGTEDRVNVADQYGKLKNYYYDVPNSYGDIVCGVYWRTEGSGDTRKHVVYFGTTLGKLYKLIDNDTAGTLTVATGFPLSVADEITSCVTSDEVNLYFGGVSGGQAKVYGWEISSQSQKFAINVSSRVETPMSWKRIGGVVYIFAGTDYSEGLATAKIYRINTSTGAVDKENTSPKHDVKAPANISYGRLHVGDLGGRMHGINPTSTNLDNLTNWPFCDTDATRHPLGCPHTDYGIKGMGFITSGYVYFGDKAGWFYKVSSSAAVAWAVQPGGANAFETTPITLSGKVYVGNKNGKFFVLDDASGATLKTYNYGDGVELGNAGYIYTTQKIYFGAKNGLLYYIDK